MTLSPPVSNGRRQEFEAGTAVFGKALTARELRRSLGLGS
jgi:hypothetical protein